MKNENNETLEKYKNLEFLIKFYCFQEELKNRINKTQKESKSYTVFFLKKNTMFTYKKLFDYSKLSIILQDKKKDILKDIKDKEGINYDKLNDSILSKIIEKLPKDYLTKIDKLDNKKLNEIEKEDKKIKFIDKYIEYKNMDENKIVRLKIFKDFDLIDNNITSLDIKLKIEMKLGECFILPGNKLLFYYKDDDFLYEIVNVDKNLNMKIEYLFNKYEISSSKDFGNYLFTNGINKLIKNFNKKSEINSIIIKYDINKKNEKVYWYEYKEKSVKKMINDNIVDEEPLKQEVKKKETNDKKEKKVKEEKVNKSNEEKANKEKVKKEKEEKEKKVKKEKVNKSNEEKANKEKVKKEKEEKEKKEKEEKLKKEKEEKVKKEIQKIIKNILKTIKIKYKIKNIIKEYTSDEKLKSLILLLIYQKILKQNQNRNDLETKKEFKEIFLINKKFLEKISYFTVEKIVEKTININKYKNELQLLECEIINANEGEYKKMNNIEINIEEEELNKLKLIESEIKKSKFEFKDESEEITIYDNKKLKIYDQFLLVDNSLYYYFKENFKINSDDQHFLLKFINQKAILKKNNNKQFMLFIINFNTNQCSIEYILDYNKSEYLEKEFNDLINYGIEQYFNEKMMFNKENNNDDIMSPIFSNEEIIGYGYKYSPDFQKKFKANYIPKYLKNETTLMKLLSLYSYYKKIDEKLKTNNKSNNGEYYLINEEFLIELKVGSGYKLIYDDLEENFTKNKREKFENDIGKNVFLCLKTLPEDILQKYSSIKFDINLILKKNNNFGPKSIKYNIKTKESINIFTNFEIIEKKIIENFIGKYDNKNILSECYFNNGKIIINLPNYLNTNNINNFVSLIGVQDIYSKYFIPEYILIYNLEDNRQKHLDSISNKLETYLNSLEFKNDSTTITLENTPNIIGTIIKYNENKEDNDSKEDNNNKSNNNEEIQNTIFNTDKPYLKDNFTFPPKIGLQNIGATCYMNSTLQCFCHIDKFVEFYKYNKESIDVFNDEKTLSNSFKILIENLWPNNFDPNKNKNCYAPYNFKDKISKMNSLFEGISACDAKDLVNFIILTLQLELNKPDNDDDNVSGIKGQTNKKLLFVNFLRDYENNNKSIISDLFYAINYNQTKCSICNTVLYNFQTYFFITFPLEEVRKYNSSKNQSNMNIVNSNSANIPTMQMQNQISINSMNMPMQNQISINSMNMPTQNQFNINSMNMPTQNQFNVSYMNMPTQNQMNMNMNMYNMSNQNNIMNNNILYMSMPQIQAPYNCNPQYNPNYNNQPFNVINNQQNIDTNEVSIIDCFEYDKRDNEMSGDNAMYCGKCKAKCNSIMNTKLETGPEVLILLLNRGKGIEFDVKIKFEENLDLENYIENKKYSRKYKLIGVITHIGDNSQDGHFISYCREPIENGEWTKYNDAFVSKVEDFKKEVIDFAMPYVLFYQRENDKKNE